MLNKNIRLERDKEQGIVSMFRGNDEAPLKCPDQSDDVCIPCNSTCPHFNIEIPVDNDISPPRYATQGKIFLKCTGTSIPVSREQLVKVGLIEEE